MKQLYTNWKGRNISIVADKITAIAEGGDGSNIFVIGSDDPFSSSETYDVLSKKLAICFSANRPSE